MPGTVFEKHTHADPQFPFFFHLDYASRETLEESYYHCHESPEILNCVSGSVKVCVNGKIYILRVGESIIIDPLCFHSVMNNGEDNSYYCLIIDRSFCEKNSLTLPSGKNLTVFSDRKLTKFFTRLMDELSGRKDMYKQLFCAVVMEMSVYLGRKYRASLETVYRPADASSAMIQSIIRYMYDNISAPFSMSSLCSYLGFSKYYLCHIFKSSTGDSIVSFFNKLRCEQAKQLIMSGNYTLGEVAERTGFSSVSYFSRVYKQTMGASPSKERK